MTINRREFLAVSAAVVLGHGGNPTRKEGADGPMYGLIGRIAAVEGRREELANILIQGTAGMPGCLSYVVANDPEDEDALWVTEVWDSRESHQASLRLPSVQEAMERGRPLIEEFSDRFVTTPVGGHGLG